MMEYIYLLNVTIFWISLGMTEGFKWTDTPKIVTSSNYHIVRGFTNLSVLLLPILTITTFDNSDGVIMATLLSTIFAWPLYEMALNYVNHGNLLKQKKEFVYGDMTFRHPPVILMPILSLIGLLGYIFILLLK